MRLRKRNVRPPVRLPLYFGNPAGRAGSEGEAKRFAAYAAGELGFIDTPRQGNVRPAGVPWCMDNGCFNEAAWDEGEFAAALERNADDLADCWFAVAPDVVGDAEATLVRAEPWIDKMAALGYPVAFVAQNGWAAPGYADRVPWDRIDWIFIGGDDLFKLGPEGRQAIRDAQAHGKKVHLGRANSEIRHRYSSGLGLDSLDGTFLTFGDVERGENVDRLVDWVRRIAADLGAGHDAAWRGRQAYVPEVDELDAIEAVAA